MKKLSRIILAVLLALSLSLGPAAAGQYDQQKVTRGERLWDTKWNQMVDGLNSLWDQTAALAAQVLGFVTTEDQLVYITATPTYADADTFTLPGDHTAKLAANKVVLIDLAANGIVFNTVASSSFAGGTTTVNVNSANLTANLTRVAVFATRSGLWPWGDGGVNSRDYGTDVAALQAAKDFIGPLYRTLRPYPATYAFTQKFIVPANIHLQLVRGVILDTSGIPDVAIAGLSREAACIVSWTNHGLVTGDSVLFSGITQAEWTALNGNHAVTYIDANSFSIPVDTAAFAAAYNPGTDPGVYSHVVRIDGAFEAGKYHCVDTSPGKLILGAGAVEETHCIWFGAATPDIAAALQAAPSGAGMRFNAGTSYVFSPASTVILKNKSLDLVCDPGVVIDATAATATPALKITGSLGAHYLLGGDIAAGDASFTAHATLAASLAPGDMVRITTDSTVGGAGTQWCPGGTSYWRGELVEVLGVSGTTVSTKGIFQDSYTAADTVAARIGAITGSLRNFSMKGTPSVAYNTGVEIWYAKGYRVEGGDITGFSWAPGVLTYCMDSIIDGGRAANAYAGTNYNRGWDFRSCQGINVARSCLHGGRHGLTGGGSEGWEPNRQLMVGPGNTIWADKTATNPAVGMHANSDRPVYFQNFIMAGIQVGGKNPTIRDNDIWLAVNSQQSLNVVLNNDCDFVDIHGNRFHVPTGITPDYLIQVLNENAVTVKHLKIRDNELPANCVANICIKQPYTGKPLTINRVSINGNDLENYNTGTAYVLRVIGFDTNNRVTIGEMDYSRNSQSYATLCALHLKFTNINNLYYDDIKSYFSGTAGQGAPIYTDTATIGSVFVRRFQSQNSSLCNKFLLSVNITDYIEFTDNLLNGFSSFGGANINAPNILCRNNRQINCVNALGLAGRYYHTVFGDDNVISWGTAAPTSGAWKQGDIIEKSNCAAGGSEGWRCTATGTFGGFTDNTGDTDGSTGTITGMTTVPNVGDWVNVSAGFPTTGPYKVLAKTATSVTINATSNSVQTNITVSTSNPTFKARGNLAS